MNESETLAHWADKLATELGNALGPWVMAAITTRYGAPLTGDVLSDAESAAAQTSEIAAEIKTLLEADIDAQSTSPLALARKVVPLATGVLSRAGVAPLNRDANAEALHPDDVYDLTPGTFSDFGPEVHEPGIAWGAAKAYVHLHRRKDEGLR